MSVKHFAAQMKATIEDIKSKGTAAIYCDNLISYLNEVLKSPEPNPTPVDIEKYKADLQNWIASHERVHQSDLEMFRSVISAGQQAIKSSFLLNGGAAVALLAFIAHLAQFKADKVPDFGCSLLPFSFGVLAAAITSGCTYLSQWLYAKKSSPAQKFGFYINLLCIILGVTSYALFIWGLFSVYHLFHGYK